MAAERDVAYIVETKLEGGDPPKKFGARPSLVIGGRDCTLTLSITSEDGGGPVTDRIILVAVHFCAWVEGDDLSRPGNKGFTSKNLPMSGRAAGSIPIALPADADTVTSNISFRPPLRDTPYRATLNVHFYLASNGALIGHLARAIAVLRPRDSVAELAESIVNWPDGLTEDDVRKGVGWIVLPVDPLPHPSLVIYATSVGEHLALAASVFTPGHPDVQNDPGGTIAIHDLGRLPDPEHIGCEHGVDVGFSLPTYLMNGGAAPFTQASDWNAAMALEAVNCLRDKLPPPCRSFLTDFFAALDPAAPPTVLISTDDLLYPWELVRVSKASAAGARTLGQVAAVGRWLHHKPLPGHVYVDRAAFIAPRSDTIAPADQPDRDLLAKHEETSLTTLMTSLGGGVRRMSPCTIPSVVKALDSTAYQVLHMRSHGTRYGVQLAASNGVYRDAVFSLRPKHLPGWDAERELKRPFVFINVCGGAFLESELWLEALLAYGVGAAVVSLWNVASDLSKEVATLLYARLQEGKSIAEAIRAVRALHLLNTPIPPPAPGAVPLPIRINPTVLSYIVLGHPLARLVPMPAVSAAPIG